MCDHHSGYSGTGSVPGSIDRRAFLRSLRPNCLDFPPVYPPRFFVGLPTFPQFVTDATTGISFCLRTYLEFATVRVSGFVLTNPDMEKISQLSAALPKKLR